MSTKEPDYTAVVELLQRAAKARRAPRKGRGGGGSALDPYRLELEGLRTADATFGDLKIWLAAKKGIEVERSTIYRRFKKWGLV